MSNNFVRSIIETIDSSALTAVIEFTNNENFSVVLKTQTDTDENGLHNSKCDKY